MKPPFLWEQDWEMKNIFKTISSYFWRHPWSWFSFRPFLHWVLTESTCFLYLNGKAATDNAWRNHPRPIIPWWKMWKKTERRKKKSTEQFPLARQKKRVFFAFVSLYSKNRWLVWGVTVQRGFFFLFREKRNNWIGYNKPAIRSIPSCHRYIHAYAMHRCAADFCP